MDWRGEQGATLAENALMFAVIVLPMAIVGKLCLDALGKHFQLLDIVTSSPFP